MTDAPKTNEELYLGKMLVEAIAGACCYPDWDKPTISIIYGDRRMTYPRVDLDAAANAFLAKVRKAEQAEEKSSDLREVVENTIARYPVIMARLAASEKQDEALHREQRHPGFHYETTEGSRKGGFDEKRPPEGFGWMKNVYAGRKGWERFGRTEVAYWMRPRNVSDAPKMNEPAPDDADGWRTEAECAWAEYADLARVLGFPNGGPHSEILAAAEKLAGVEPGSMFVYPMAGVEG